MSSLSNIESEAKSWLKKIFPNSQNLSVIISGKTEKGDGYLSDIFFVEVSHGSENLHLVLKCSKQNPLMRQIEKFRNTFFIEIFFYEEVLPQLIEIQTSNEIKTIFKNVPKSYGTIKEDNVEVIVLENMRKSGYELWSRKEPLTRQHIDLVIREYGRLHATSTALRIQQPEKFQKIFDFLKEKGCALFRGEMFKSSVIETVELFRSEFDTKSLEKWENLVEEVESIFDNYQNVDGFRAIIHGDCWNNNFMFMYNENQTAPIQVTILDWQLMRFSSPIYDLSYFLFSCISKNDIESLNEITLEYYSEFSNHLSKFGIDSNTIYSQADFLKEWSRHLKFGLIFSIFLLNMCVADKEDLMDVGDFLEKKKKGDHFLDGIKEKYRDVYKNRVKHIIEFVARNDLI